MKGIINYIICTFAATMLVHAVEGQTLTSSGKHGEIRGARTTDTTICQRMQRDLNTRNSVTGDQQLDWRSSNYGYYGTYSTDSVEYMARYDKEGKYLETLAKKEWNNNAPAKLRSSYDQSSYKLQKVTGYWEVTNPDRKGYYLELSDGENQSSEVWANEDGEFSETPMNVKSTLKNNDKMLMQESPLKKNH